MHIKAKTVIAINILILEAPPGFYSFFMRKKGKRVFAPAYIYFSRFLQKECSTCNAAYMVYTLFIDSTRIL